jgi:hypothetical protein
MQQPSPIARIIDTVGVSALARAFGHENVSTVSSWKIRGAIPVEYWRRLIEIFAETGHGDLTFEELTDACAARKMNVA